MSAAAKHTQSPWFVDAVFDPTRMHDVCIRDVTTGNPTPIATAFCDEPEDECQIGISVTQAEANARLLAASQDLLKACQQAIVALKGREHDGFLRDAIEKATGERP